MCGLPPSVRAAGPAATDLRLQDILPGAQSFGAEAGCQSFAGQPPELLGQIGLSVPQRQMSRNSTKDYEIETRPGRAQEEGCTKLAQNPVAA